MSESKISFNKFGQVSTLAKAGIFGYLLLLRMYLSSRTFKFVFVSLNSICIALALVRSILSVLLAPASSRHQGKSMRRVAIDTAILHIIENIPLNGLQYLTGSDVDTYSAWCKSQDISPDIENLKMENACGGGSKVKIMWIGERPSSKLIQNEKVLLYVHGMLAFAFEIKQRLIGEQVGRSS